jgi:DNA recombination protein RmuC
VLLATPTSLIALLRAVAYGWQQEALTDNARQVQGLGAQLYERISVLGDHMTGVGRSLTGAVTAYNKAVGSLEGRVLVTARRFAEMGVVGAGEGELIGPQPIESAARPLQAAELLVPRPGADGSAPDLGNDTSDGRLGPVVPMDPLSEAAIT